MCDNIIKICEQFYSELTGTVITVTIVIIAIT